MLEQLLFRVAAATFGQDFLRRHEGVDRHNAFEGTLLADPHLRRVVNVLFLELERVAVVDVVADVLLVGQDLAHGAIRPRAITIGVDGDGIEPVGDLTQGQVILKQPTVDLVDGGHFVVRTRHQDHPIGLQALVLARFQDGLDRAGLIDEHPTQPKSGRASLPEAQLDQAALACKHLG